MTNEKQTLRQVLKQNIDLFTASLPEKDSTEKKTERATIGKTIAETTALMFAQSIDTDYVENLKDIFPDNKIPRALQQYVTRGKIVGQWMVKENFLSLADFSVSVITKYDQIAKEAKEKKENDQARNKKENLPKDYIRAFVNARELTDDAKESQINSLINELIDYQAEILVNDQAKKSPELTNALQGGKLILESQEAQERLAEISANLENCVSTGKAIFDNLVSMPELFDELLAYGNSLKQQSKKAA